MIALAQQPPIYMNFASIEEGVSVFGSPAKSNADIIMEMLAKMPTYQVHASAPLSPLALAAESLAAAPSQWRSPPGLEFPAHSSRSGSAVVLAPFKEFADEFKDALSTTDEGFSEHSFNMGGSCDVNSQQGKTTLMVRNLPVVQDDIDGAQLAGDVHQEMLIEEWKHAGTFDFLYLPRTAGGQTNLSYAFINFASEAEAMAFQATWNKQRLAQLTSRKPLNISFAEVQGLQANLTQLRKKRTRCSDVNESQPLVLVNGHYLCLSSALQYLAF
eukprot:CAMPEP_0177316022 /NCGR_PEP_ID=MMETSP0368-20130122/12769_1 /TAXON_ID=447022 ORGANISM="Scrippsiella hangoei-like, Strain SHHI-4" /NCGR_SAMPLE_ID=MMETSP0368 /ASSEMBLY_ACC=CAM_ASM_000363 /LENGTH=271 /DNA_ID=CAMNT_0018775257 /DNA_START=74 /DNA_END=890 /DNA_ORIENTATION=+